MKVLGVFVCLLVLLCSSGSVWCRQVCEEYPSPDPCLPGGIWDPILNSCSGYNERPCYQCYTGVHCQEREDLRTCRLSFLAGNPLFAVEYWATISPTNPCTSTLANYRPAYQFSMLPPLQDAIQKMHLQTGNAEVDGYQLVSGMGATMVLNAAVYALSKKLLSACTQDCPTHVEFFAQRPYYPGYSGLVDFPTAKWNPDADPDSPWTIEIVTYPNNPDGSKRSPLVQDPDHVIMDMVYYWPMYTDIDEKVNKSIMVFSSSKHDGLAGSRFGWALVRDADLASSMWDVVYSMTIGVSVDIEMRVLTSMEAILNDSVQSKNGTMLSFHQFGRDKMYSRFSRLRTALDPCSSELQLQNSASSPGAYAWIHCNGDHLCADFFAKVNVTGESGTGYGATDRDIRFSMLMPSIEFEVLLDKLKLLCLS